MFFSSSLVFHFISMAFVSLFLVGHATLHLAVLVGPSVGHISEFQAVFAVLLLPNRPLLDCRVSGLVSQSFRD